MFKKKPTTVAGVYEQTVADIKQIKENEKRKVLMALEAQAKLDAEYKARSEANAAMKDAADREVEDADIVIHNFENLFNRKGK